MQHDPGFVGIDGIDGRAGSKVSAETCHALREADLAKALVALLLGDVCGWATACAPGSGGRARVGVDGRVVDNLIINRVVGIAQRRVENGEKTELSGRDATRAAHGTLVHGANRYEYEWVVPPRATLARSAKAHRQRNMNR